MKAMRYKIALVSLLSLPAMLLVAIGGPAAAAPHGSAAGAQPTAVTSSSLGSFKPTFVGSAGLVALAVTCSPARSPPRPRRISPVSHYACTQSRWTGRGP